MNAYNSSLTRSYKCGFIHSASMSDEEVIRVQVDLYAYPIEVRSIQAAKMLITKHLKSGRALINRGSK